MQKLALIVLLLASTFAVAQDSPLVAAAKSRKNAKLRSKIVITNATLSKSGGHISTTAAQPPLALPKETPKPEAQPAKAAEAKPSAPKNEPLPQIEDAMREADGPVTREELEYLVNETTPIVILPKNLKAIEPQQTNKPIEPQQSQKPKPKDQ
jgi:hypothetical protein